jgi:cell fate (sporulation/competence/biofilm development) regulator YlbF (YheA/YmcA/DUF963 family)
MEMTKELGNAIRNSSQMENMNKCEEKLQNNAEAKMLMNDYIFTHRQFMEASNKNKDREVLEEIHRKLTEKQQKLNENEITRDYLKASDDFNSLIQSVNSALVTAIRGTSSCSPDGCSSCSGCS